MYRYKNTIDLEILFQNIQMIMTEQPFGNKETNIYICDNHLIMNIML